MELTVQIATKNNESEIESTIRSVKPIASQVIVVDMGSTDSTTIIAQQSGAEVVRLQDYDLSLARNIANDLSNTEWQFYLHPGEVLIQGHDQLKKAKSACCYASILQENMLSKEIRVWRKSAKLKFVNPVYEFLDANTLEELPLVIYSGGQPRYEERLRRILSWQSEKPTAKEPYYFQAMTLLAMKRYDEFLAVSEHYMFIDNKTSVSTIMNHYYYALVQIIHKKKVKPALQNLNLCLCAKPLMAEFWCLLGDVYYHLLKKFSQAKEFYEMAMILGGRRLTEDRWPMDISKYKDYPELMIQSCDKITSAYATYL